MANDRYCVACGTKADPDAGPFCAACGTRLAAPVVTAEPAPPLVPAPAAVPEAVIAQPMPPATGAPAIAAVSAPVPRRRRSRLRVLAAPVLLLVVYGAVSFWLVPRVTALDAAVTFAQSLTGIRDAAAYDMLDESSRAAISPDEFAVRMAYGRHILARKGFADVDTSRAGLTFSGLRLALDARVAGQPAPAPLEVETSGDRASVVIVFPASSAGADVPVRVSLRQTLSGWSVDAVSVDGAGLLDAPTSSSTVEGSP